MSEVEFEDDDAWETLSTGRSSNSGCEAWIATQDGSFVLKSALPPVTAVVADLKALSERNLKALDESNLKVLNESNLNSARGAPDSARKPSMTDIKAAGRAKVKAARAALAAEEAAQQQASTLWTQGFDFIFDSTKDHERFKDYLIDGRTVLVIVPGFASHLSLTPAHVERWNEAAVTQENGEAGRQACSLVFKWPCGQVKWTSEDAQVEAAAAWQEAHDATFAAARSLTLLLQGLEKRGCSTVVAAHSLGARVALQALANDLAAPRISGLLLLGGAVDNHALTGLKGEVNEVNGVIFDGVGAAPAEFPFNRLMSKCAAVALAHSTRDPTLTSLWQAAEYARCGRVAPPALGATGPEFDEDDEAFDESWTERVLLLDVTAEMDETHDPTAYLLTKSVKYALRASLFPLR